MLRIGHVKIRDYGIYGAGEILRGSSPFEIGVKVTSGATNLSSLAILPFPTSPAITPLTI
jgi:hypothetical protein